MRYKVTIEQQTEDHGWAESIIGEVDAKDVIGLIREVTPVFLRDPEDRIVLQVVKEEPDAYDPEGGEGVE